MDGPGVWPANGLDPPLAPGVDDPAPKLKAGVLSDADGVAPKVTDGLLAAGVSAGAEDPKVKAGVAGGAAAA